MSTYKALRALVVDKQTVGRLTVGIIKNPEILYVNIHVYPLNLPGAGCWLATIDCQVPTAYCKLKHLSLPTPNF